MMGAGDPSRDRLETVEGPPDPVPSPSEAAKLRAADRGGAELTALSAQALSLAGACGLRDLQTHLGQLEGRLAALDPASLIPRQGLAGLFDSRSRRAKAFRDAYRASAGRMSELADALSRGAGALTARHEALSGLWTALRDAVTASAPPPAAVLVVPDRPDPLDDHPGNGDAPTERQIALSRMADLRAARNAEHVLPGQLLEVRDGVLAWQAEWDDALGLTARGARTRRPDAVRLETARSTLLDRLARANAGLDEGLRRKDELARRAAARFSPAYRRPSDSQGTEAGDETKDGTASQA
ncbi:hypothetical protein BZG35_12105 [Brevundimonas sp. LM2]|uniref:hypothetical protein n=1 Tax=Brevundimonas sp. LM2 TaxID=1938605 RepID=UPI000983BB09|nr:hypothetical protein [Brevundimonas sp. LM2]AQR62305.1 hypothetical protein BZG35_12105 [Brevundimonas sp. LM2]